MMPGANFKDCLESPYLSKNSAVRANVTKDLADAQALLSLAAEKAKAAGDAADVTLASYRSMYCAAKALMHDAGYEISNFRFLLTTLDRLFVAQNKLDKALVDQLVASQKLVGNVEDHLKAAEQFLAKAKQLTGSAHA